MAGTQTSNTGDTAATQAAAATDQTTEGQTTAGQSEHHAPAGHTEDQADVPWDSEETYDADKAAKLITNLRGDLAKAKTHQTEIEAHYAAQVKDAETRAQEAQAAAQLAADKAEVVSLLSEAGLPREYEDFIVQSDPANRKAAVDKLVALRGPAKTVRGNVTADPALIPAPKPKKSGRAALAELLTPVK